MVPRVYADKEKQAAKEKRAIQQKDYLPRRVQICEAKKPFVYAHKDEYYGGDFD